MSAPGEAITCKEFAEFLDDYLEDALDDHRRSVFDRHMALCPCCVNYLATYRRTIELARDLQCGPGGAVPENVPEDLITAILAARRR